MKPQNKTEKKEKMPAGIIAVIIGMIILALNMLTDFISMNQFSFLKKLFGSTMAWINLLVDILIFIFLIILIILFIKRKEYSWKLFIYFIIVFLIINLIWMIIIAPVAEGLVRSYSTYYSREIPPDIGYGFFITVLLISDTVIAILSIIAIYIVYKNRSYFNKK